MKCIYSFILGIVVVGIGCGKPIVDSVYYDPEYKNSTKSYIAIDSNLQTHAKHDSTIAQFKNGLIATMGQVIGYSSRPLTKAQPECTLGYLAVDALFDYGVSKDQNVVGAVINYGGIRIDFLASGPLTVGHMFEIMPFDNTIVVLDVPGAVLKQWCQHMVDKGGWPLNGIYYEVANKKVQNVQINNKPINDHIIYKIVTTDYVANGGDDCEFLKKLKRQSYNKFHRDVMIEYVSSKSAAQDTFNYQLENRILYHE